MTEQSFPIEIHLLPSGQGRVVIDGRDISNRVYGINVSGEVGESPKVTVTFIGAEVKVLGSAWVEFQTLIAKPGSLIDSKEAVKP